MPADAVVFVLLDGFRHDYLSRTRFLRDLSARSTCGQLEEPFGFCPRGAYFGGLSMAEQGYTHMFRFDPRNSVFRWTRDVCGTADDAATGAALTGAIRGRAQKQLTAFAGAVHPWGIPLEWQHYFDFAEREAPWSRRAGYTSLFHILDDAGEPWLEVSWPFNGLGDVATDGVVAGEALRLLSPEHRFAFIHLPALDALGHQYGPGSRELQRGLTEADRLAELIYHRAQQLFERPAFVFAGDHGMLPVVAQVDVASALAATELRFGHDFAYFIDSTTVRCWFFTTEARQRTFEALASLRGGKWLDAAEKRRWEIDVIDPRNGEEYFLADPGVVFSPSFFDWSGQYPPRGMHGYVPDAADNRALVLAHSPGQREAVDAGIVCARRLFPTFLQLLGRRPSDFTQVQPVALEAAPHRRSRWYFSLPASADTLVDAHMSAAVAAIRERSPNTTAVIVAGGFGRGEGTPARRGRSVVPSNDYDMLALGANPASLSGLSDELARQFDVDFVDLSAGPSLDVSPVLRLGDFDLRYGGRVVWGDPGSVERLGAPAPSDLDLVEAAFLVGNRTGGLLLGWTDDDVSPAFRSRQTSKFLIGIADAWLIAIGDYTVSYAARRARFHDLGRTAGFSTDTIAAIDLAYTAKLDGSLIDMPPQLLRRAFRELESAWERRSPCGPDLQACLTGAVERHLPSIDPQHAAGIYHGLRRSFLSWPDNAEAARAVARRWLAFFH